MVGEELAYLLACFRLVEQQAAHVLRAFVFHDQVHARARLDARQEYVPENSDFAARCLVVAWTAAPSPDRWPISETAIIHYWMISKHHVERSLVPERWRHFMPKG